MGRGKQVGKECCGCIGPPDRPNIVMTLCVGEANLQFLCECLCHEQNKIIKEMEKDEGSRNPTCAADQEET